MKQSIAFQKSKNPTKWKLDDGDDFDSKTIQETLDNLATIMGKILKRAAPIAHSNMVKDSEAAIDCRIGLGEPNTRPFCGVTAVCDFCAHSHTDFRNADGAATVGLTLKNDDRTSDVQFHVLTKYRPAQVNSDTGGVALALANGAVLIECAKLETHATTKLENPHRINPSRMGLIFYLHRFMDKPHHGGTIL